MVHRQSNLVFTCATSIFTLHSIRPGLTCCTETMTVRRRHRESARFSQCLSIVDDHYTYGNAPIRENGFFDFGPATGPSPGCCDNRSCLRLLRADASSERTASCDSVFELSHSYSDVSITILSVPPSLHLSHPQIYGLQPSTFQYNSLAMI